MTSVELAPLTSQPLWASFFVFMAFGAIVPHTGFCTIEAACRHRAPLALTGLAVGAIGVSGAPDGEADDACAQAGIAGIRDNLEF